MALALTHFMIHTQKYVWAYKGFCSGVGKINHAHPFFSETFLAPPRIYFFISRYVSPHKVARANSRGVDIHAKRQKN